MRGKVNVTDNRVHPTCPGEQCPGDVLAVTGPNTHTSFDPSPRTAHYHPLKPAAPCTLRSAASTAHASSAYVTLAARAIFPLAPTQQVHIIPFRDVTVR